MVRLEDQNHLRVGNFGGCFNSSMVRLEDWHWCQSSWHKLVSIPVWFDWKSVACQIDFIYWSVSIPVWFDWKKRTSLRCRSCLRVSIPVWFDWKTQITPALPLSIDVSIPVWFDWKCPLSWLPFDSFIVSIPVWFDWKPRSICAQMKVSKFQFQYGSIGRMK